MPAYIYVRTVENGDVGDDKLDWLRFYADKHGFDVRGEFVDIGERATAWLADRPKWVEMRRSMRSNNIDTILIMEPAQITRHVALLRGLLEDWEAAGIYVYCNTLERPLKPADLPHQELL